MDQYYLMALSIYMDNGNNVVLDGIPTSNDKIFTDGSGNGLYGAWPDPVPEPETYGIMLVGLGLIDFMVRRHRNNQCNYLRFWQDSRGLRLMFLFIPCHGNVLKLTPI